MQQNSISFITMLQMQLILFFHFEASVYAKNAALEKRHFNFQVNSWFNAP